ncbi:hypothetical protein C7974DRAFT_413844 [Boeremia exigua]|uniref:uncharacterized protein n=1 Tax=Boeremia exigua TaxID=749465 RepID=UPI001E8E3E23|nr:uncharacterized protein C7974DRAFT_413844 [Boeremia exigua]KAH6625314.1 hypothetical protein C7974DRAFT_413844 [Boeremia exigua]
MRIAILIGFMLAVLVATVAAGSGKPSLCDLCRDGYNSCMGGCKKYKDDKEWCEKTCDCQVSEQDECEAKCGYGTSPFC